MVWRSGMPVKATDLRIDRSIHQDHGRPAAGEQRAQHRRNFSLQIAARIECFCSLDIDQRALAHHLRRSELRLQTSPTAARVTQRGSGSRLESLHRGQQKLRRKSHPQRKGGQQLHAVARVVPGVRPPRRQKDRHRPIGHRVGIKSNGKPQQQRPLKGLPARCRSRPTRCPAGSVSAAHCPTPPRPHPSQRPS